MGTSPTSARARLPGDARTCTGREAPTILVLDPDWDSRQILQTLLHAHGYRVLLAQSIAEAREHALRRRIALVISESREELGRGSLLAALREDLLLADVPVVVHTSWIHPSDRMLAVTYGATAFMPKPYDHRALLACIQKAVAESEYRDGATDRVPGRPSLAGGLSRGVPY